MSADISSRRPNIRMVAERAQLSATTVSLALRGAESVPPETRERVLAAARELNYVHTPRPARAARTAARQILFVAGMVSLASNPFYGEVLHGAEQECGANGGSLVFSIIPNRNEAGLALPASLYNHRPDGVLLVGPYGTPLAMQLAAVARKPMVLIDNRVLDLACDSVMADDFGGAYVATRHLIQQGHQHIIALIADLSVPSYAERYRGYVAACQASGIPPLEPISVAYDRAAIRAALAQALHHTPRPTGIFSVADYYAVVAMDALRDLGYRVPDDISVVGFDNEATARLAYPPLTTMNNHPRMLGRLGMQRLLARINGDNAPPQHLLVGTELVVRASTRTPTGG